MSLRFHEIAESRHRILNPFTDDKLQLVGEICDLSGSSRVLDLCCGKGEMLCTWAARHRSSGVGVDSSEVFLKAARQRASELGVEDLVDLIHHDASTFVTDDAAFDVVCCIGATWIGEGLVGTLRLMRRSLAPDGLLVVGEPYWTDPLPSDTSVRGVEAGDFASLAGTLERFNSSGLDLIEMVLADGDSWDRYVASQWRTVDSWLRDHPDDPDAGLIREWIRAGQRSYMAVDRRYLGWGVFVLRAAPLTPE